jgi:hypothetical protein
MAEGKKSYPGYPKAKYKKANEGLGDIKQQYSTDRHPFISAVVTDPEEDKALGPLWFDTPAKALEDVVEEVPPPEPEPAPNPEENKALGQSAPKPSMKGK